ncbi:flippase-like domain-containing protein [Candidatus Saccharibacteria bacterium]|nr:flippase-like domain-containing protein [Candidatus Saccharibacteria bacterium]
MKKHKKIIGIILFVLLNAVVIVATAFSEFGNSENAAELSEVKMNWWLLIPAVLCFIIAISFEIFKYVLMIRRLSANNEISKNEHRTIWRNAWKVARRTVLLGKYYDNITPAAIGGQPFQIYYMRHNSGLTGGNSTSVPIFGMISNQIAFLIIAILCFIFGGVAYTKPTLMVTAWLGLLFYAFWPVMVAGVSFFPKPTTKFLKFLIRVLAKIKIIKDREKALAKIEHEVDEYAKSIKRILKTRGLFFQVVLSSLVFNGLIAMIPFFVLTAFGGNIGFFECFTLTIAVMSAVYFVPTPGNAGAAEGTFFLVFSSLSSGYVFWAMLLWRFFSYYIYIIIGPIIYFLMHLEKKQEGADIKKWYNG